MERQDSISQEKNEKPLSNNRKELIQQILKSKESLAMLDKKLSQQNMKFQKMTQSNARNEKRLLRYQARMEQMGRYKNSPQHFLTMSGYMNEYVQQYIFSHNYAFNINPNQAIDPDHMSYQQLIELGDQIGKVSKGLNKNQIQKLAHRKAKKGGEHCPICQNEIQAGEDVIDLKCKHTYHQECILFWLKEQNTCPICKQYLADKQQQKQSNFQSQF